MKFQLTKTAKQELKVINAQLKKSDEYYDKMTKRELLISDAMLYVEDAYVDNKFTKLDVWCKRTSGGEYDPKYLAKYPNAVKQKIGKMIMEDIITIVE